MIFSNTLLLFSPLINLIPIELTLFIFSELITILSTISCNSEKLVGQESIIPTITQRSVNPALMSTHWRKWVDWPRVPSQTVQENSWHYMGKQILFLYSYKITTRILHKCLLNHIRDHILYIETAYNLSNRDHKQFNRTTITFINF